MTSADAIVIGGGIAGASTAYALAKRGARVLLLEAMPHVATKASGNDVGLVMPYFAVRPSIPLSLYTAAFTWSRALIESLEFPCIARGGLQLPSTPRLSNLLKECDQSSYFSRVTAAEGAEISGVEITDESFFAPMGCAVSPPTLVQRLLHSFSDRVSIVSNSRAVEIRSGTPVEVRTADRSTFSAPVVCVCGAYESSTLDATSWLPLEPIRGQIAKLKSTPPSTSLRSIVCFEGYIAPAVDGTHVLGAHYRHHDMSQEVSTTDTEYILRRCATRLPGLSLTREGVISARVCFRTSTIDRLPYIGPVPEYKALLAEASTFQPGSALERHVQLRNAPGLYVSAGHGSRGLLSGPLGGELLARQIYREDLGDLSACATICNPGRIVYRLIRQTLG